MGNIARARQLRMYVEDCAKESLAMGAINGLLLTGLTRVGLALMQAYVDRTSEWGSLLRGRCAQL